MIDESRKPKQKVLGILNKVAPLSVSREIVRISSSDETGFDDRLSGLLDLLRGESNAELDRALCQMLGAGRIRLGGVASVAPFILTRVPEDAVPVCLRILEVSAEDLNDVRAEHVAVSLLRTRIGDSWIAVKTFVTSHGERGRRVLGTFACDMGEGFSDSMSRFNWATSQGYCCNCSP